MERKMEQNLLIIDDEPEILSWLEEMFRYDFDREVGVYTARSGKEALELLNRVKFEVVLTDIHMPQMDGITLFHKVKENWPRCRTVFLTGYQNFDDVYQVFQHRDVRYVLKSESDEKIMQTVEDAFEDIEQELEQENSSRLQKEQIKNATLLLTRKLFTDALEGRESIPYLKEQADRLNPSIDIRKKMLLYFLRIDEQKEEEDRCETLIALLERNIPEKLFLFCVPFSKRTLFCFVQPKNMEQPDWDGVAVIAQGAFEYAMSAFFNQYGIEFSAVTDQPVTLDQIATTALTLRQHMVSYVGKNSGMILYGSNPQKEEEPPTENFMFKFPALRSYLELGRREAYFELLKECTDKLQGKSAHDVNAMEIYYSIATLLLQFINENGIYRQLAFKIGLYKLMKADEHENWYEATGYLYDLSGLIFDLLGDKESDLTKRALDRVIQYINEHLSEDLPLTRLAQVGGFNASYLSRLFGQVCGQTVTEYITGKRMKKAKELLSETEKKITQVSAECGYLSSQSFSRAFRASEGISPIEYRELHAGTK